ncbi:hypothetical protein [Mucilaginibacter arboris]|uniref:Uncharacterized protein n=1 Tax=Mucilaginibacter arboris TaxID=2682090 RepID=A0A7K1T095_9SPHI|nr:hypothetical protein [Mucilaginibacter arboris]MVN22986.1 hypothetical protein [Mucilaginibacter arboris]
MSSMPTEMNKNFSLEDFEKGLMLAGLVTPSSLQEYQELASVQAYEKSLKEKDRQTYFKRVVLAAEIVERLHNEPSLGRVKFQKLVYICEHMAEMRITNRYDKQAAGPFDNKFMYSIGKEFRKQKWFAIEQSKVDNYTRYKFVPLEKHENYKGYYNSYFGDLNDRIQFIIELFRKQKTEFTELATTVFACFLELKNQNRIINQSSMIDLFYNWAESKRKFSEQEILNSFEWLRKNGLIKHTNLI